MKDRFNKVHRAYAYALPRYGTRTHANLLPSMEHLICENAVICTDELKTYVKLREWSRHHTVCHSRTFKAADGTTTNAFEGMWSCMKRVIRRQFRGLGGPYTQLCDKVKYSLFVYQCGIDRESVTGRWFSFVQSEMVAR